MGFMSGRVMCQNFWNSLVPSMLPASYSSGGTVCRPARNEMAKNGRPRQAFTRMMENIARLGLPNHNGPCT